MGEVWGEVMSELQEEGVRPVTPDHDALNAISRTISDKANHVTDVQKELLEAQKQQDLLEEQEFYAEVCYRFSIPLLVAHVPNSNTQSHQCFST